MLLDVKRGDIGSTMQGYADAYLAPGAPLAADAVTLSPYLGFGSLAPALDTAVAAGRGVFVLARTSNAEGAAVQSAVAGGRSVAQGIVDEAAARNRGAVPLGAVGLVVGATADHGLDLAALNGPVLAPGLGAQGAGPADIAARFRDVDGPVLPSASRSVLAAGPDVARLRAAASALRDELVRVRVLTALMPPPRRWRCRTAPACAAHAVGPAPPVAARRAARARRGGCAAAGGRPGTDRRTISDHLLATCDRSTAGSGRRGAPIALSRATPT